MYEAIEVPLEISPHGEEGLSNEARHQNGLCSMCGSRVVAWCVRVHSSLPPPVKGMPFLFAVHQPSLCCRFFVHTNVVAVVRVRRGDPASPTDHKLTPFVFLDGFKCFSSHLQLLFRHQIFLVCMCRAKKSFEQVSSGNVLTVCLAAQPENKANNFCPQAEQPQAEQRQGSYNECDMLLADLPPPLQLDRLFAASPNKKMRKCTKTSRRSVGCATSPVEPH